MTQQTKVTLMDRRSMLIGSATAAGLAASSTANARALSKGAFFSSDWDLVDAAALKVIDDRMSPGLSVSVMKDGKFLYSKGHGSLDLETNSTMTPRSVFKIASITKQMTAAALLKLQEQGKLALDDRLSKYIPSFERADNITLYQLATHTAGLGDYPRLTSRSADQAQEYDDERFLELLKRTDPLFVAEPGTKEVYSNTDYGLLGLIINQVSGTHYGQFLQEQFFSPLGMNDTGYDHQFEVVPQRVSGYSPWQEMPSGFANADYIATSYPGPSGSIRSTSEDLCRWHQALVFGQLLKPESYAQMVAPVSLPTGISYYGMGVRTVFPRDPFRGRNVVSHGGRISGFATDLWSFPEQQVTVATLLNSDGSNLRDFGKAFDSVRDLATQIALGERGK